MAAFAETAGAGASGISDTASGKEIPAFAGMTGGGITGGLRDYGKTENGNGKRRKANGKREKQTATASGEM